MDLNNEGPQTGGAAEVAFASWQCNCTMLAETREEIPDRCPRHAKGLLGPIEWVSNIHNVPLGFQLALPKTEAC